ncbi:MAG: hypothetical protein RDV41_12495, partial [Planctomycetota bacterium]|nr:hypothetical protein [Planctomycetota bacterium]
MKRLSVMLVAVLVGLAAQLLVAEPARKECDVARVEDAPKCAKCDRFLDKEDLNDEGKCKKCGEKPLTVKACVKVGYVCKEDGAESFEPGTCPKCKNELSRITVKSEMLYKCQECGSIAPK